MSLLSKNIAIFFQLFVLLLILLTSSLSEAGHNQRPGSITGPTSDDDGAFTLSWTPSESGFETYYEVMRRKDGGTWSKIASPTATFYDESGLNSGTYDYRVRGCDGDNCGSLTPVHTVTVAISVAPGVPGALVGPVSDDDGSFLLSWGAASGTVTAYSLERNSGAGWAAIYSGINLQHAETGLADGVYQYRVKACNNTLCSEWTATHSTTVILPPPPGDVGALTGPSALEIDNFTLTWGAASGTLTHYELDERSSGGVWGQVYSGLATSFSFTGHAGGTFDYRVRACNGISCSNYSAIKTVVLTITATPDAPAPYVASPAMVSAADITATDQVGASAGSFRVDESGAATYNTPIATVAGTAGVAPQISLDYSSQGGNGSVGLGWSIGGLSGITRCRQTLHQDNNPMPLGWNAADRFCLDGQRLLVVSGTYGSAGSTYKTEIDSFSKITAVGGSAGHPDYFTVERKDGSTTWYGYPGTTSAEHKARNADGTVTTNVLTWAINKFQDSVGNFIIYGYDDDSAGHRISYIRYAFGANTSWTAHAARIEFTYAERPDDISGYVAGYQFKTSKRLSAVKSYSGATLLREYKLTYKTGGVNALSKLASIQECVGSNCLPATNFTWAEPQLGFSATAAGTINLSPKNDRGVFSYKPADINGDGNMDLVWLEWDQDGSDTDHQLKYALSDGTKLVNATFDNGAGEITFAEDVGETMLLEVIDYNADGRQDVILFNGRSGQWQVQLSKPQSDGTWKLSGTRIATGIGGKDTEFGDINSDGLVDLLWNGNTSNDSESQHLSRRLVRDAAKQITADSFYKFDDQKLGTLPELDDCQNIFRLGYYTTGGVADYNGDGLLDVRAQVSCISPGLVATDPNFYMVLGPRILAGLPSGNLNLYYSEMDTCDIGQKCVGSFAGSSNFFNIDINQDGHTDVLYRFVGYDLAIWPSPPVLDVWRYRLSSGAGFDEPKVFLGYTKDLNFIPLDYNHDGYTDIIWHDTVAKQLKAKLWNPETNDFNPEINIRATSGLTTEAHQFIDVNGDGVQDYIHLAGSTLKTYLGNGSNQPRNMITKVTNGLGAETVITYEPISDSSHYEGVDIAVTTTTSEFCITPEYCTTYTYSAADTAGFYSHLNGPWHLPAGAQTLGKTKPVLEINGPIYVVTRVDGTAPAAGASPGAVSQTAKSAIEYFYAEAKIQASGRGFLGFEKLKTVDLQTGVETITTYRQDWPFIGYPQRTEVYSASGAMLSMAENTWKLKGWLSTWPTTATNSGSKALGPIKPYIDKAVEKTYDLGNGALLQTITTDSLYDNYGNPTKITVTTVGGGETFKKVSTNTYGATTWEQEKGRLSRAEVATTRAGVTATRVSGFTYFTTGALKGLLATETIEPDNSAYTVTTSYSYDQFGNKVRAAQTAGGVTRCDVNTAQYDALGRYVDTTWDCLGRKTSDVIARNEYGAPLEADTYIDANGLNAVTTSYAYTPRGLRYFETTSNGAWSTSTLKTCASGDNCPTGAVYFAKNLSAGGGESREYFDKLGRTVRSATVGFAGAWVYADTEYDKLGRVKHKSEPYFSGQPKYWNKVQYDILGRVTQATLPDNSIATTTYNGFSTTLTNDKGQQRTETVNALGETVQVIDHLGGKVIYGYDFQGNMTSMVSQGSPSSPHTITTALSYDLLGRKTAMDDPDKGQWAYTYNGFGELTSQTDAKGQRSAMGYDGLGRMVSRVDYRADNSVEGNTAWAYDSAPNGLGQLDFVTDTVSGYLKAVEYDSLGRVSKTVTSLGVAGADGDHFEKVTYDQFGRPFQVFDAARNDDVYDDNGVETRYNAFGYQSALVDAAYVNGQTRSVYQEILAMDARGNVTSEKLGNNATTSRTFDALTGRINSLRADHGISGNLQNLSYTWDTLGNLTSRLEQSGAKNLSESFLYDGLNRLTSYQVAGQVAKTLSYDSLGNITHKSDVGNYSYGADSGTGPGPHAVISAGGTTYTYDANGNNTSSSDGRTIAYTTFDQAASIVKGGHTTTFAYGPDRARYKRVDSTTSGVTTTLYIGSVEKITQADGSKEFKRYIGGVAIMTLALDTSGATQSRNTHYLYKDHLGSLDIITDAAGQIVQEQSFDAWGQRRDAVNWQDLLAAQLTGFDHSVTTRGFTGHEMLDEVGIIHMNGRIYDPKLGRFLQADPFIQEPTHTQSLNRYSYVLNNPLNATDPSGYFVFTFAAIALTATKVVTGFWAVVGLFAAAGFADALLQGASFNQALFAGVISGVSAAAFSGIGAYLEASYAGTFAAGLDAVGFTLKVGLHGITGGIMSVLQGGKFGHGFAAAGFTALSSSFNNSQFIGGEGFSLRRVVVGAVLGGTASKLSGGKFANGAVTGAFSQALNYELAEKRRVDAQKTLAQKFRDDVIEPTLDGLGMGGDAAEELLLGTAIQESNLTHRTQLGGGPGLGLYQMEPATHDDIWNNYLKYRPDLAAKISAFLTSQDKLHNLQFNDAYATAMSRVHYSRVSSSLPNAGDISGQASYWKAHYNTPLGKGTISQYIVNWKLYTGN